MPQGPDSAAPVSAALDAMAGPLMRSDIFILHFSPRSHYHEYILAAKRLTVLSVSIADHLNVMVRAPSCRIRPDRSSFRARLWRKVNWEALCLHLLQADHEPSLAGAGD